MAHIRQSGPDSGLGFQVKLLRPSYLFPLCSSAVRKLTLWACGTITSTSAIFFELPVFLKLTVTDPFAAWFVVIGDATPDGIRVVRSVLEASSSFPIVAFLFRAGRQDYL